MSVGDNVTLTRRATPVEPGYTIDTFSADAGGFPEAYQQDIRKRAFSGKLTSQPGASFRAPKDYSDHRDHHLNFALAMRSRKPVVEDAVFGFRAAGPALLSNISYFRETIVRWDPAR